MDKDKLKILLFASYPEGTEFEEKNAKIERLKKQGYDINIAYLVTLQDYGRGLELPIEAIAERQIKWNIRNAIEKHNPNLVAFHSGTVFREFWEIVKFYIWDIYIRYEWIKILVEDYDAELLPISRFEGLDRMDKVIEKNHELYQILWN